MKRPYKKRFVVPIFDAFFWIIICDDISPERQKMEKEFGECPINDYGALCSWKHGNFGIFFSRRWMPEATIAHEIFHATHRIMEWCECNFDPGHHEQGALLCGYLSDLVRKAIAADKKRK